jgi:hypothetical protein
MVSLVGFEVCQKLASLRGAHQAALTEKLQANEFSHIDSRFPEGATRREIQERCYSKNGVVGEVCEGRDNG